MRSYTTSSLHSIFFCPLLRNERENARPRRTSRLLAFRKGGSLRASWVETSKVFAQAFFKRLVGVRGRRPCGLSRLRQTQEGRKGFLRKSFRRGLRFRSGRSWARATGTQDPSSGGAGARWAPFSADRAGRRDPLMASSMPRGLPQARLPCPRKRAPPFGASGRKGQARCHCDRLCGSTRGGHSSPLFLCMGRRWLRPRTPVRSWGFTPNPTSFLKKT